MDDLVVRAMAQRGGDLLCLEPLDLLDVAGSIVGQAAGDLGARQIADGHDVAHVELPLDPYDDAVSVRDRLSFVKTPRVLLVWPDEGGVMRRKLDLLLVLRHAERLGMRLALVTTDPAVIAHARDLNLSVFPDAETAARSAWKQPRAASFTPPPPLDPAEMVEQVQRRREIAAYAGGPQWARWAAFTALLLAIAAGFVLAAPSATITITPASRQVHESVTIMADPALTDIDLDAKRMPASVVSLEATSHVTVQSSGRETGGASLAQGLVTFTNEAAEPVLIPLGTVVATSSTYPVRFETRIEATLPGGWGASVQVPVRALAQHAGPAGNVEAGAINRIEADFAGWVSVANPNATYGGAVEDRSIVTQEDHQRLLVLGRQQVLQHARDLLLHQLSGDQFLVPGSVAILEERPGWTIYSAIVGDAAESVSLDLRARVQAVVVDERQARQLAYAGLAPYLQPGLEIAPDALTFARGEILEIAPDGRVTFLMNVNGTIGVAVEAERVRSRLAGASVSEAQRRLAAEWVLDPQRPPVIETWPGWYHRLPFLPVRITVKVEPT